MQGPIPNMFKLVHYEAHTASKRAAFMRLKCLLVYLFRHPMHFHLLRSPLKYLVLIFPDGIWPEGGHRAAQASDVLCKTVPL